MKLKDKHKELKKQYPTSIILIKSGNFYTTYNEDALILNSIFLYQIINNRIGFPLNSLDKVTSKLNELSINYIVIIDSKEDNIEYDDNKYLDYYTKAKKEEFIIKTNELLLERISFLLKNRDNYEKIKRFIDEF